MSKTWHSVNGKLLAQPAKGAELLQILLGAAKAMEHVDGCYCYLVGMDPEESDAVHIFEVWTDEAAHRASLHLPHFQDMIARARPLMAGMKDTPSLVIYGGKAKPLT